MTRNSFYGKKMEKKMFAVAKYCFFATAVPDVDVVVAAVVAVKMQQSNYPLRLFFGSAAMLLGTLVKGRPG
jgi:hypothetical protein